MTKLIVGLANPGIKYAMTRHNAGAWYIDKIVKKYYQSLRKESRFYGYTSKLALLNKDIYLLIPATFMNFSGKAVAAMVAFYKIKIKNILIAHDELALLPGNAKFKFGGSHGGHNGLKSIINFLGNNQFHRLRIGIGRPDDKSKVANFVLKEPTALEQQLINDIIDYMVDNIFEFII